MNKANPTWRTMEVPIDRVVSGSGPNPNVMSAADLARLTANVRETGIVQPILVYSPTGELPPPAPRDPRHPTEAELVAEASWLLSPARLEVIDGEHRFEAARTQGFRTVPVTVIDATPRRAAALRVSMNKLRGELDLRTVAQMLADLAEAGAEAAEVALDPDVQLCGYGADEVADLLAAAVPVDPEVAAMGALGAEPEPEQAPERKRRYLLEVVFEDKEERDRARDRLKALGDGNPARGLQGLLSEAVGRQEED